MGTTWDPYGLNELEGYGDSDEIGNLSYDVTAIKDDLLKQRINDPNMNAAHHNALIEEQNRRRSIAEKEAPFMELMGLYKGQAKINKKRQAFLTGKWNDTYGQAKAMVVDKKNSLENDSRSYRSALMDQLKYNKVATKKEALLSYRSAAQELGPLNRSGYGETQRGNAVDGRIDRDREAGARFETAAFEYRDNARSAVTRDLMALTQLADPTQTAAMVLNSYDGVSNVLSGMTSMTQNEEQLRLKREELKIVRKNAEAADAFSWTDLIIPVLTTAAAIAFPPAAPVILAAGAAATSATAGQGDPGYTSSGIDSTPSTIPRTTT